MLKKSMVYNRQNNKATVIIFERLNCLAQIQMWVKPCLHNYNVVATFKTQAAINNASKTIK